MNRANRKKSQGFTLIELLVVISIIGLLSTLAVVSLNSARAKARDAKRVADIRQVQTALELYYNDKSQYPVMIAPGTLLGSTDASCLNFASGFVATPCANPYMGLVPLDPLNSGSYIYTYTAETAGGAGDCTGTAVCTTYEITFALEGKTSSLIAGVHTASQDGIQ